MLRELGYTKAVHGFRSSFRTWCGEVTDTPWDIAEASLTHTVGSRVQRAYARTDYLAKRRQLMQAWATFATTEPGG